MPVHHQRVQSVRPQYCHLHNPCLWRAQEHTALPGCVQKDTFLGAFKAHLRAVALGIPTKRGSKKGGQFLLSNRYKATVYVEGKIVQEVYHLQSALREELGLLLLKLDAQLAE